MRDSLRAVVEGMGDGVVVLDERGAFLVWNAAAERILRIPRPASANDATWTTLFAEGGEGGPGFDPLRRALAGAPCDQCELRIASSAELGSEVWVSVTARLVVLDDGSRAAAGAFRDVTPFRQRVMQQARDAAQVRATSAKLSSLIDHLSTGVLFEDASEHVQLVNRAYKHLFPDLRQDARSESEWLPPARDRDAFFRTRRRRINEGVIALADRVELADGRILERDYVPVDVQGLVQGHFWCYRDVTERERARAQLAELSNRDDLTALYNRRGFITLAEQWLRIAARTRRTPLLLFVDVNGMKPINDRLGHAAGDRVLRDTADLLRATFRESDIVARQGGDEFVVLAVDALPEHAALLCERLQRNIDALNELGHRPYRVSLSVGVSAWDPAQPRSIEELLAEADARMYEAKRRRASHPVSRAMGS